jgi:hypothetical protein
MNKLKLWLVKTGLISIDGFGKEEVVEKKAPAKKAAAKKAPAKKAPAKKKSTKPKK